MIIEPSHFEYLSIQRGEVSDYRHDFDQWKKAYLGSLREIAESIWPVIPKDCENVLDIGGGMGGIDLLLSRRYKTAQFSILDGLEYKPHVYNHNIPFANAEVAMDFHKKNGNDRVSFCWPGPSPPRKFDLVLSFAAYFFHIAPVSYWKMLQESVHENTCIIFEVRRERRDWLTQLVKAFGKPTVLAKREKFVRVGFRCAQSSSLQAAGASASTTSKT